MRQVIATLLITLGAAATPLLRAQEPDSTTRLREIVVVAPRSYSAATDVRLRAADFALQPRSSAQDLLRLVAALVIAQHAGGGKAEQIFLRGFDADHGTDVNISVDDAPVNMVSHGHGQGYADMHFVIPETIERTDALKGPYFAHYGDFMTAGAVALTTRDSIATNVVRLEAGSFETWRAMAMLGGSLEADIDVYVAGELSVSDGYFDAEQNFTRAIVFGKLTAPLADRGVAIGDLSAAYRLGAVELSVQVENALDALWNEAQFDTESRLRGEAATVGELHFTPGAPRSLRCGLAAYF